MRALAPRLLATAAVTALIATNAVTSVLASPCVLPDNGTGTVTLPDPSCGYISPNDFHMIIAGLPPGTEVIVGVEHRGFLCGQGLPQEACNTVLPTGETLEEFDSVLQLTMDGTGELATFHRQIQMAVQCLALTGPRTLGDPVQTFPNEMVQLQGGIFGDPDFDLLTIKSGSNLGLPSPGLTTLTRLGPPGTDFQIDSFFDIAYEIEFQGAPGSVLSGLGGVTTDTIRMQSGDSAATSADERVEDRTWGRVKSMYQE